jgi:hypothetical protein
MIRFLSIIRSLSDSAAPGGDFPAAEKVLEAALVLTRHFRSQI